jgi:anaerobic ribonucleoside-triphosphate reductase activating protein
LRPSIEGITVSGGEPLQQWAAVRSLLWRIRRASDLSVVLFTGYTWQEVRLMGRHEELRETVDVVVAGRYVDRLRLARGLLGSTNKTVHLMTDRYAIGDLARVPSAEVVIAPDGAITLSGIDPVAW